MTRKLNPSITDELGEIFDPKYHRDQNYYYVSHKPNRDPFYVGINIRKGIGDRCLEHDRHNEMYVSIIKKHGLENIKIDVFLVDSAAEAKQCEKELIHLFWCQGYKLANMTIGGDGASGYKHTPEAIEKIAKSSSEREYTQERNNKISKSKKGAPSPLKGRILGPKGPLSQSHRKKLSKVLEGRVPWNKGQHLSEDHCKNIAKGLEGKERPQKARENISKGNKGKPKSPEHRANMRIAARKRASKQRMKKLILENLSDVPYDPRPAYSEEAYRKA